jgi:hypothetical protein
MNSKDILDYETKLRKHRNGVHWLINQIINELNIRSLNHDLSKYSDEERPIFQSIVFTDVKYGTPEYYDRLNLLKEATGHHYEENRHHPEHFKDGLRDMNLIDLIEMICDWMSAAKNYNNTGNIYQSIKIGQKRFGYDDTLKKILLNTVKYLEV